ncbi:MAG: hypothetical protein KGL39_29890, partial [Patescibacteria group bacterium]|nr:hypothetical protein [Patescibacteria group bacterium]
MPEVPGYSSIYNPTGAFGGVPQAPGNQDQSTLVPEGGGGGGAVDSVTAADNSILVTGTTANPILSTGTLDQIASLHPAAASVTFNNHKIINLLPGVASTDAATVGQIPTSLPPSGAAGGDLFQLYPNPEVVGIWSRPIASTSPSSGQANVWNGSMWLPSTVVGSVTAGDTSIVVGGTSTAPTIETGTLDVIATDHPPAANWSNNGFKITGLANGSASSDAAAFGQIPTSLPPTGAAGGDLSGTYPNPAVAKINGSPLGTTTGAATNAALGWNGSLWVPMSVLIPAHNLSDVADAGSSRFNLSMPILSAVAAVAVANVNIASPGATLDSYALQTNDEILLTAQSTSSQNGVWTWNGASSALTRPNEFPSAGVVKRGRVVQVVKGTVYANSLWLLDSTAAGLTIDTSAQSWVEFTAAGSTSGDVSGNLPGPLTVVGLQGHPIASTAPAFSDVLEWNGTDWTPTPTQSLPVSGNITFITHSWGFGSGEPAAGS